MPVQGELSPPRGLEAPDADRGARVPGEPRGRSAQARDDRCERPRARATHRRRRVSRDAPRCDWPTGGDSRSCGVEAPRVSVKSRRSHVLFAGKRREELGEDEEAMEEHGGLKWSVPVAFRSRCGARKIRNYTERNPEVKHVSPSNIYSKVLHHFIKGMIK